MVKLDGKLVRSLMENDRSSSIIASIAELSATLDFELLAEFVETAEQRERLAALGCRLYPGIFVQSGAAAGRVHGVRRQIYRCATGRRPGKTACRNGVTRGKPRKP